MKKQLAIILVVLIVFMSACSNGQPTADTELNNPVYYPISMTDNPSAEEVKEAISVIDSIIEIRLVTEENDPNGHLGKQGGYTGCIYFVDSNAPDIKGTDAIEKGTDGGGCIEIYANLSDANKRNDYLAAIDGGILASGSHCVLGTLVIRTSNELAASKQKALEQAIIDVLEGRVPESLAKTSPLAESIDFKTEIYARLEFLIDSSWEKKLTDDGRYLYYPTVSEPTGFIQCSWSESQIGDVSTDQAQILLSSGILEVQKNLNNVEEISKTYFKIGNKNAIRVTFYHDLVGNDINSDNRGIIDMVVVLFNDGISIFSALFTETEYNVTYSQIIKTAIESIEVDTKVTSSDTFSASSTPVENNEGQPSPSTESSTTSSTTASLSNNSFDPTERGKYREISVAGGDISGTRLAMVVVDVGFGDREYWAYTNEHGQLVRVIATTIVLQDDQTEPVNANGRYFDDEAKVLGTEREDLDEGHVIADSLGGVSNAYNITPQDSIMNRHGDQAYMEKGIRDAGGCTGFEAIITYPDEKTQIPSHYQYTYKLMGNVIVDSFDNVNPDVANQVVNEPTQTPAPIVKSTATPSATTKPISSEPDDISSIDTNKNGKVTIAEAKAAGFKMPITSEHWLYKYMDDRDGDGQVGE